MTFYERRRLYRFNPCDVDALPALALLGRALARFSSGCPCCDAVRTMVWIGLASWKPLPTALIFAAVLVALIAVEIRDLFR